MNRFEVTTKIGCFSVTYKKRNKHNSARRKARTITETTCNVDVLNFPSCLVALKRKINAIFAKKTTDFEFNVTNNVVQKERFRYFIKVPELAAFYNEVWE